MMEMDDILERTVSDAIRQTRDRAPADWQKWADNWLSGLDRSRAAAHLASMGVTESVVDLLVNPSDDGSRLVDAAAAWAASLAAEYAAEMVGSQQEWRRYLACDAARLAQERANTAAYAREKRLGRQ